MKAARTVRLGQETAKLLMMHGDKVDHFHMEDLVDLLPANSIVVVNQAATLPARFEGKVGSLEVELRLVRNLDPNLVDIHRWQALVLFEGSWRQRTEDRQNPDFLEIGDIISIKNWEVEIISILHHSKRFVEIELHGNTEEIWKNIYQYGKPIQYSHLTDELHLWDVQTIFSSFPVAIEPPSASFQFNWKILNQLANKGIEIVGLIHATSISSTGIADLDQQLPFPETYILSPETATRIQRQLDNDKPVVAIGTSVTRALEDNYQRFKEMTAGTYTTSLVIDENHRRSVVSHLFTGMHLPKESHMRLLLNFSTETQIARAYQQAVDHNYLWHEYGDVSLIRSTRMKRL